MFMFLGSSPKNFLRNKHTKNLKNSAQKQNHKSQSPHFQPQQKQSYPSHGRLSFTLILYFIFFVLSRSITCSICVCIFIFLLSFQIHDSLFLSLGACFFSNFKFVILCLCSNISNWWVWPWVSAMRFGQKIKKNKNPNQ